MTIRALGILLLKLWGLIALVTGFIGVLSLAFQWFTPMPSGDNAMDRYVIMTSGLGAVVSLVLGTVLLLAAERIVGLIQPSEEVGAETAPDRYTFAEMQALIFGGVGAFLAIGALSDIAKLVYSIARQPEWDETGRLAYMLEGRQELLAGAAVQLLFAVILLVNRTALAAAWSRVRPMKSAQDDGA